MPGKIRLLSEETINQIAAGEIIENPASAIKEMIENAIDASARRIQIDVHGGGHLFFQVVDDGIGMGKDDAVLCLERHATSKIKAFSDLLRLHSMGFRGEALASILAVSKMEIETSEEGGLGTKVIASGGKIVKVEPCARNRGTTIKVSSLFYNVPARKKFQKAAAQSTTDIVKMVTKLALAHREVAFTLTSHGKELLSTSNSKEKRVEEVLGKEFLKETKEIVAAEEGYTLFGIRGSPLRVFSNRLQQYLFINKRPVVSPLIERAIQSGFGTRIGTKQYPLFVIWMELSPERVDVNVHPQKIFVRFAEEEKVYQFVKEAIEKSFSTPIAFAIPKVEIKPLHFAESKEIYKPVFTFVDEPLVEEEPEVMGIFGEVALIKMPVKPPLFLEETLVFIDIQRLEAKLLFHTILDRLEREKQVDLQQLMFPETLSFSREEVEVIGREGEFFEKLGIGIRPFGKDRCVVDSLCSLFTIDTVKEMIDTLLIDLKKGVIFEQVAKKMASFPQKKLSSKDQIKKRVQELFEKKDPAYAPNGKLIFAKFNKDELFDLLQFQ